LLDIDFKIWLPFCNIIFIFQYDTTCSILQYSLTKQENQLVQLELYMKGTILDFSVQTNTGVISG
jgi:hypothetical protein